MILFARPKRFELLTPRFVVWCPNVKTEHRFFASFRSRACNYELVVYLDADNPTPGGLGL
jgi:hypothetical protein